MKTRSSWTEIIPKLPAWISGGISFVTALIGFVLLIEGHKTIGLAILVILVILSMFFGLIYVAFAKTRPLIEGGKGVLRFEKYRPAAFGGIGFLTCLVLVLLFSGQARSFVFTTLMGSSPSVGASEENSCLNQYFSDVPANRIRTVELGANWLTLFGASDSKKDAFSIHLTNLGQPVGAVKVYAFPEIGVFRVDSVMDTKCQWVTDYSNMHDADKSTFHPGDAIRLPLEGRVYLLLLEFDNGFSDIVVSSFVESAP